MPDPISAIGAAVSIGGGLIKAKGSKKAARQQAAAIEKGITGIEGATSELEDLFSPFIDAASPALREQMKALGLINPRQEAAYIRQQELSPIFQGIARQGETAMLQNASATGGLRGGNIQAALAQFRPALLNQFLQQRFENLGGLTRGGLAAAGQLGTGLLSGATSIADLRTDQGAAKAGGTLAATKEYSNMLGQVGGLVGGLF